MEKGIQNRERERGRHSVVGALVPRMSRPESAAGIACLIFRGFGFSVKGEWSRVSGLGCSVKGLSLRVWVLGFEVEGVERFRD